MTQITAPAVFLEEPAAGPAPFPRLALGAAGTLVAFTGAAVLAAWRHRGESGFMPAVAFPLSYGVAIGLTVLGLGAMLMAARQRRAAFALGLAAAVLGAAAAAGDLFGFEALLGFAGPPEIQPGAGIGLMLGGASLACLAAEGAFGGLAAAAASGAMLMSAAALAGEIFGVPPTATTEWSRLAPGAAAGLGLLSIGFFLYAGFRPLGLAHRRLQWVPELAGLAALLFTVVVWQALRASEWFEMRSRLELQSIRLREALRAELDAAAAALDRMGKRWEFYRAETVERQYDAALLLSDFPVLRSVAWLDEKDRVLGAAPRAERTRAGFWAAALTPEARQAAHARRLDLGGRPGVLLYSPFDRGFSLAVLDGGRFVERAWLRLNLSGYYGVEISDAGGPLYREGSPGNPARELAASLEWRGLSWRLKLWRTSPLAPMAPLSTLGLVAGLVLSALVYQTTLLSRRLRQRARTIQSVRSELAAEASRRIEAERQYEEKSRLLQLTSAVLAGREQSLGMALREVTESRDRLRALAAIVDASEDAIVGKDLNGLVTSWNAGAEKIYGYKREEIIGKSVTMLAPPDQSEDIRSLLAKVRRGDTVKYFECQRMRKDGRRIDVSLSLSPIRDAAGAVVGASVVARDVTEAKRAQETLRRNEALIRQVLETLPVGLSIADEKGAIVAQNQKMREIWSDRRQNRDNPLEERKGWWADTGQALEGSDWPLARAVALGETSLGSIVEIESWDGARKTLVCNAVPLRDPFGKLAGGIEVQEDITEKRRAEQALALHSVILRNMKEGVCLVRASDAAIVYANPKFEEMYGYPSGELLNQQAHVLYHLNPKESKVWRRITESLAQGGEALAEIQSQKKDGTPFWCAAHTSEFTHPAFGKVLVTVHEDISEKKTAETRLRQSLQEKEVLLQEVHHRVKNNMQIISSLLQLQSQHIKNPRVVQVVQESRSRIRSMALIHEKLYRSGDLARVHFEDYVKSLVADVVRSFTTASHAPKVRLEITPVQLDLDTAIPLGLLINELVSNAVKHAFPGKEEGEILVELRTETPKTLTLRVKDDGVGFLDAPVEGEEASFGLRLVRILSEQLGGKAEFSSGPGVEFRVSFPMGAGSALPDELAPAENPL